MGLWTWLTGKKSSVTATDRIWLTKAAKRRGLCRELFQHRSNAQPSILFAHFPATLREFQQELNREEIPHRLVEHSISGKEITRLADPESPIHLGLVKQLQPDPFPDQSGEREGSIYFLIAERHFLRECDDVVISFAESFGIR